MKKIPSFTIDHTKLLRGIYVSRKDSPMILGVANGEAYLAKITLLIATSFMSILGD